MGRKMTLWTPPSEDERSRNPEVQQKLPVEQSTVSACSCDCISQNLSGCFVCMPGNGRPGIELQQPPKETIERNPGKAPARMQATAAVELLASWPKENRNFDWMYCKGEIFCVFGTFNLLVVLLLVGHLMTGKQKFLFIFPCLVTIIGSIVLLGTLVLNFARSQATCFYTSPVLVVLAFLSWFIPNVFCKSGAAGVRCGSEQGHSETVGLLVSISLPSLLSAAPLMTWQASCFLSVVIPTLFLSTVLVQDTGTKSTLQIKAVFPIVVLLTATNVLLQYLRTCTFTKILAMIDTWADAFIESKLHEEQALGTLEEREKDNAEKVNKMRQFISYIFHEIRVPFNAVVLGIGHLLACNISDDQQEILKMMEYSSSSMIRILNDVLDMGKIESGKLHLEKQPFNMGELVSSLIWAFKDTFDSKGIEFSLCIDPGTKDLLSNYDLLGDKHRVSQVLSNYLSNAMKFTPRGGKVHLRVICNGTFTTDPSHGEAERLQALEGQGLNHAGSRNIGSCTLEGESLSAVKESHTVSVTISVEDTGIGISKEDQAILFEPYTQISAGSSQAGGGTGLGLSFAKRIVELAGGKIGVFSEVGKGSIFLFTIPFELVQSSLRNRCVEVIHACSGIKSSTSGSFLRCSSSCQPSDRPWHNPRVLIVEDNPLNRRILRKLLESLDVESDDAENGKQAVELVREGGTYDMIFIDKEMPVMDGHVATRELRAMGVRSPIVGLTGNALESDRNQFLAAGVDEFFTKPLSRHQLVKLLQVYGLIVQKNKNTPSSLSLPSTFECRSCQDGSR